jgi:hypothetical protein
MVLGWFVLWFGTTLQGNAQGLNDVISFAMLKVGELTLSGPADIAYVNFRLPADWELNGDGELRLNFSTVFLKSAANPTGVVRPFNAMLEVEFNDMPLGNLLLDEASERVVTFPLSMTLLTKLRKEKELFVTLRLVSNEDCGTGSTQVIIRASSSLRFPHRLVAPPTDLKLLPYPLLQGALLPDVAMLVIPDSPSPGELQAALTLVAGWARQTGGALELRLSTLARLSAEAQSNTHLIFVGKPAGLPLLQELTLPAPASGAGFNAPDVAADDGIVQMVVSPWNPTKVVLIASGNSDLGVLKAAQAVISREIRTNTTSNLALVISTRRTPVTPSISPDYTFAGLGYATDTRSGIGTKDFTYRFNISPDQVVNGEAYLNLSFANSAMLDYEQSGLSIGLNNELIGSVRFTDRSTQLFNLRLPLPIETMRIGTNALTIHSDLLLRTACSNLQASNAWVSIRSDSVLHLPLGPAKNLNPARKVELRNYPAPFSPTLERTAFVLATNDPIGWSVAADIAADLARRTEGDLSSLAVVYSHDVPETLRQQRDLLLIGRPSTLKLLNELSSVLPAPFELGSDLASEPSNKIVYRLPKDIQLGYLEILVAPWATERTIMAVLGAQERQLRSAAIALTNSDQRRKLNGNFAVVDGEQVIVRDVPSKLSVPTPVPATAATTPPLSNNAVPNLTGMALGVLGVLVIILGTFIYWRRGQRAKATSEPMPSSENDASHTNIAKGE